MGKNAARTTRLCAAATSSTYAPIGPDTLVDVLMNAAHPNQAHQRRALYP
jgi:hypothetical protein